jgi:hypothetical protein
LAANLYATGTDETIIRNICRHADVEVTRAHYIKPSTALVQPPMQNLMKVFAKVQRRNARKIARRSAAAKPSKDSVTRIK